MKRKMTYNQKLEELSAFIALCFAVLSDESFEYVAERTGLSLRTVRRLWYGEYTIKIQWNTVHCLGQAAGLRMSWTETGSQLELIER